MTASPSEHPPVLLHIGAGSFHRAHQAWYLHRVNAAVPAGERWTLTVGNIRDDMRTTMDALAAQHGAYTLETVTPQGERAYETIRAISRVLPWSPDLAALIDAGADPACRIVSFTVTEGGYYLDEHNRLDLANADLAADLQGARTTLYGALAALLAKRVARGAGPLTLQSCDNLRNNGARFRAGMRAFLEQRGETALLAWFDAHVATPSAMVDRITPRPTPDVRERVRAATGIDDACPVMAESFIQWVIEDRFAAGRPRWELAGAELVDDVHPYEEAKIRILNATHSCIAWAGTLAGHTYIHEGTHDAGIRRFAHDYVTQDVIPCLTPSP
ncbi:MAG: mannitol dehydrogenase family protein, partial [Burkholderia vietnamiensis]|nr:mannitol dehydrogenase family protein [Burkholderia vietnamiensis]